MSMDEPILTPSRRFDLWIMTAAAVLAAALYFGTAIEPGGHGFSKSPSGYYGRQTEGFRQGHLYNSIVPDPALLALKDPYDPTANAPYRVHDMTLYGGHYYLYFGVTPILLVFWPVVALTGYYPTEPMVVASFCTAAVWLALALLWAIRRRYFPDAAAVILALGAVCLVVANPMSRLAQGPLFYHVAISSAICLQMAMIAALYRTLLAPRHPLRWLLLASGLFGLAVGSRPNYLASGVALLATGITIGLRAEPGRKIPRVAQALAAAGMPAAGIGLALLAYNWIRFQSPFEFGMRYQLAGETFLGLRPIQLKYIWPHLGDYLFRSGTWSRYFPFFEGPSSQPYGFLRYLPWAWLAPLAFLPRIPGEPGAPERVAFAGILALASVGNLLLLASFFGTTDRYPGDYTGTWLLLSGIGALALSQRTASGRWSNFVPVLCGGLAAIALFDGAASFLARAPGQFPLVAMGRVANWPLYVWRRAHGEADGALQITLILRSSVSGGSEPIFETGRSAGERDWLQLDYRPDERARLVFRHAGLNEFIGDTFPLPTDRKLEIEARCGSLLPPFDYPGFAGWTRNDYAAAQRDLQVKVNGVERLRASVYCYDSSRADLTVGRLAWPVAGVASRFSGQVVAVGRLPLERIPPAPSGLVQGRAVELWLHLPEAHGAGSDPILVTGSGTRSDLLSCIYDGRGGVRFALDHYGAGGPQSATFSCEPKQAHRLTIWMGSLSEGAGEVPPKAQAKATLSIPWSHRLLVRFDGHTVLNVAQAFYPGNAETALIGINPYGSTTAGRQFNGRIDRVRSIALDGLPPIAPEGEYGSIDLSLKFPLYAIGRKEPIVVSGSAGAGDVIYVRYVDLRHVSFGFDHWGGGGFAAPPVEIDYGQPHRLSMTMGSLYPAGGDPGRATLVQVAIDGRIALEGQSLTHPSEVRNIRICTNPIGASSCGPIFTGTLLADERVLIPRPWPPLVPGSAGALDLSLYFPAYVMGTREPLVVTGTTGAGDLVYVRYLDSGHVGIGFDHWGLGGFTGAPFPLDYAQPHHVLVTMGSLYPSGDDAGKARLVRVLIDGKVALEGRSACHPTTLGQTTVGLNRIGGSTCGPAFTGRILAVVRAPE